jgi:tetratricopeptide (TPR) repeat protein
MPATTSARSRLTRMAEIDDVYAAAILADDEERWADAARLFQFVVERDPGSADALSGLARAYTELHRYPEARATYERLIAIEERHFRLTMLGAIQNHLGDHAAAIATLRRSLALEPNDDEAHFHLGLALRSSHEFEAALGHFFEACRIDPAPPSYHREVALTLWKLERFDEALEASQRALSRNPADSFARHGRGLIHESIGDFEAAKQAHLRAAEIEPDCGLFWASAARMAARQRRDREADALFRRGLASDPESAIVCRYYGEFLQRRGRLPLAARYLHRTVQLDPDSSAARRALEELGRDEQAEHAQDE